MAKRANNEGSLHKLPNGHWRAQMSIGCQRVSHTAGTKRECQEWIKSMTSQVDMGMSFQGTKQTLAEYLEAWLLGIQSSLREGTFYQYKMTCRRHILPALGQFKLVEVRPAVIQGLYAAKLKSGTGPRTVEFIHQVLHRAFEHAIKLGILGRNPVDATTPPKVESKEMSFYDENQANEFLLAAKGTRNETLYHLAIATGLRQSEILGLKWTDLDWKKRTLLVQRQLKRQFEGQDYYAQPKTKNSRRAVLLGPTVIELLKIHLVNQEDERKKAGARWQENGLIFPTPIGTPKNQSNLYREFKEFLAKANLPQIRFHDLRHTAATLLLNHGIAPIIVSRRLGHHKTSMTLDIYGHLITELQDEAADLIDELITPVEVQLHTVAHDEQEAAKSP